MKPHTKQMADHHENYVADVLGGKVIGGSGCGFLKGDVNAQFIVECKATANFSRAVKIGEIQKIRREAQQHGKNWALAIRLGADDLSEREDVVVIDLKTLAALLTKN